jgi:TonB family protein
MKMHAQPLVIFVILGLSLCEGLGHSRYVSEATQEIASEVYNGRDVAIKAIVKKRPEPSYTRDARKNKIEGTVILRCIFASNGKVTNIHVVSGLPDGLTERAVKAAQKIKFKPATRDGKPVSMWMQVEYNFNLR